MGYDASKDEKIKGVVICEDSAAPIEVSLNSYDGGQKKIQLQRYIINGDQKKYTKLKRLSIEEAERIIEALKLMIERAKDEN